MKLFIFLIMPNCKNIRAGSKVKPKQRWQQGTCCFPSMHMSSMIFKSHQTPLWLCAHQSIMAATQFIKSFNCKFGQIWLCILASLLLSGPYSSFGCVNITKGPLQSLSRQLPCEHNSSKRFLKLVLSGIPFAPNPSNSQFRVKDRLVPYFPSNQGGL